MAKIPANIRTACIVPQLVDGLISQGKVRDTYKGRNLLELLIVATDRLSIFDFVLNALILLKGVRLTRITRFWFTRLGLPNHLVSSKNNPLQNAVVELEGTGVPIERSLLVRKARVLSYELIFRHHIGGSVYKDYLKTGMAGGQELPRGLPKWSALDEPIFTPSTKSESGHDINITAQEYFEETGEVGRIGYELALTAYKRAYAYAKERGFLILDTKFEVGVTPDGEVILLDEVLTPDSSRFAKMEEWRAAMAAGRDPEFYDKELVRIWGRTVVTPFFDKDDKPIIGINNLDPENDEHVAFVHSLTVPQEILDHTAERYQELEEALTSEFPLAA